MPEGARQTILNQETNLAILEHKIGAMHSDFIEMKSGMRDLTTAVNKLVLIEERQAQMAGAQERAFNVIKQTEERLVALEKRVPETTRVQIWVDRAVFCVAGAALLYVAKAAGLL